MPTRRGGCVYRATRLNPPRYRQSRGPEATGSQVGRISRAVRLHCGKCKILRTREFGPDGFQYGGAEVATLLNSSLRTFASRLYPAVLGCGG